MANINSFFNKSSYVIHGLGENLVVVPDIQWVGYFSITDIIQGVPADAITSILTSTVGRVSTEVPSTPVWEAPPAVAEAVAIVPNDSDLTFKLFKADIYSNRSALASVIRADTLSSAYYIVLAIDEDGEPLATQPEGTINIQTLNQGATDNTHYTLSTTTPTIGSVFSTTATAVGNADTFVISITGSYSNEAEYSNGTTYTTDTVITTIRDITRPEGSAIWGLTDTITSINWDGTAVLNITIVITNTDGSKQSITTTLQGGD